MGHAQVQMSSANEWDRPKEHVLLTDQYILFMSKVGELEISRVEIRELTPERVVVGERDTSVSSCPMAHLRASVL
jgi:hypothetical protein